MSGSDIVDADLDERPVSQALRALGATVGTYPWPFLLLPLVISGALGSGFIYLSSFNAYDIEGLFTPIWSLLKDDRRFVQMHFPTHDSEHFSAQRLSTKGTFAAVLAVATEDTLLTQNALSELLMLDWQVRQFSYYGHTFAHLCARSLGICSSPNPLISALNGGEYHIEDMLLNLTWPLAFQGRVFLAPFLGGVKLGPGGAKRERPVQAAKALRLFYFLQEDNPLQRETSKFWLKKFLEYVPEMLNHLQLRFIHVAYFTSLSTQEEFEKGTKRGVPWLSIMYSLTIFLSIISCARLDCVRTRVWVAAFGVFSAGLSVLSSFGLLFFCRVPFFITTAIAPFIVLGVGIDNMFILVSCWQRTKVKDSVKDRMADTYAEAALSVTITNITNIFTFIIGVRSSFQSIRLFCLYTGIAFVFCYLYSLTFLGAVLALNGRREESNRHWLTFMKVETEPQDSRGYAYNMCCVGGAFDESTGTEIEHTMSGFFRKYYGPFLMRTRSKVVVVVLYLLYLGSSIYGFIHAVNLQEQDIDLETDNSYFIQYYDWENEYFSNYGPRIMVVVTKSLEYWDPSVRGDLEKCMESLENSPYVDKELSESWLRSYGSVALQKNLNMDDRKFFIGNLTLLFKTAPESQWDIDLNTTEISASRFYIQSVNITTVVDKSNLLRELRGLAKNCKIPVIVYHPTFINVDERRMIPLDIILTVLTEAVLIICLLLIPTFLSTLWVLFAYGSITFGVFSYMWYWDVNLYRISSLFLIVDMAFSVNFCGRIAYGFVSSAEPEVNDKAVDALYRFGYPVAQGAVSIILGVIVLYGANSYIFRTYFKMIFLAILFAAVHGLIFTPVFLSFCGCYFRWRNRNCLCC